MELLPVKISRQCYGIGCVTQMFLSCWTHPAILRVDGQTRSMGVPLQKAFQCYALVGRTSTHLLVPRLPAEWTSLPVRSILQQGVLQMMRLNEFAVMSKLYEARVMRFAASTFSVTFGKLLGASAVAFQGWGCITLCI